MSDSLKEALGILILAAILAAFCMLVSVRAEMAPNFPAQFHPWLHGLRSPQGGSCCGPADCGITQYRIAANRPEGMSGYQVWYGDRWLDVPADRVVRRADNPTGHAVLCISPGNAFIYCFVPASEG